LTGVARQRPWNELAAEVVTGLALEHVEQNLAGEDVDAHRRHKGLGIGVCGEGGALRDAARDFRSRPAFGFSSKATIFPSRSKRKMPICVAVSASTGWAAMVMSARCCRCASSSAA
jgi:hypothetical protein